MEWLTSLYPKVRKHLLLQLPDFWPDFRDIVHSFIGDNPVSVSPEIIIPLCACKAVGGSPEDAVEMSAGLMSMLLSVRILDDLQDQDKTHALHMKIGYPRALNAAFTFTSIGHQIFGKLSLPEATRKEINQIFSEGSLITLAGQDRDLLEMNKTWKDYWLTTEMKTCFITSTGAGMGAIVGTKQREYIAACQHYGYHWGLTLQIMNDLEGIWEPEGISDLEKGKITLPLLYGLTCQHAHKEELVRIVKQNQISQHAEHVKAILNNIDTKSYLVWAALEQRQKAIEAIEICPDREGKEALQFYLNAIFADIDDLLKTHTEEFFPSFNISPQNSSIDESMSSDYESYALKLRHRLRF